jgi:hypothetical protein
MQYGHALQATCRRATGAWHFAPFATPDAEGQIGQAGEHAGRGPADDAVMTEALDLTAYDGKVVFVELRDGSELAGPASVVGDRLDIFGRLVSVGDVVSIEAL